MHSFLQKLRPRFAYLSVLIAAISCCCPVRVFAQIDASPSGQAEHAIRAVRIGDPTTIPGNFGDTWAAAWGDDGNLYSPVNDGSGFVAGLDILGIFTTKQITLIRNDPKSSEEIFSSDHREAAKAFSITPEQQKALDAWGKQLGPSITTIGFNRISGDNPLALLGVNLNPMREFFVQDRVKHLSDAPASFLVGADGRTWKSSGCAAVDGVLYLAIARHDYGDPFAKRMRQDAANASIIKSSDYGLSWTRSARENLQSPMFPGAHFATPYFIDYGRTRPVVDGADRYVYAISNNGFWDNGDSLILGRVLRSKLGQLNGADWEFFTGGDGMNERNWKHDAGEARPILEDPLKLGETGATYLPALHCYLMVTWFYPDGTGHSVGASKTTVWNFYESSHAWGPWNKVGSHIWSPQGYYCPGICPKFQSANRIYVITAGDFNNGLPYYHLTVVPVDLH